MVKLVLSVALLTLALFANTIVPSVVTVTFHPDTTLTQVVDLLNKHDTWANDDIFLITPDGSQGFFYFKDSMTVSTRERAVWAVRQSMATLDGETPSADMMACAQNGCAVPITRITLINPPAVLLDNPIIAESEAHRDIHPFFWQILGLGRRWAP